MRALGLWRGIFAVALLASLIGPSRATAGEIALTVVNVETPQGIKVWLPQSITAQEGDTVKLKLINKLDVEHGYKIEAFGIEEVVAGQATKDVSFKATKKGIFPITCQLHPPHLSGQLVVLDD